MRLQFATLLLLCSFSTFAQKSQKINSGEIIAEGVKLHNEGKYKDAIKKYTQVSRNDTNYVMALYETAYSLQADSNYAEAIKITDEALDQESDEYDLMLRILKGSIIDDNGDSKRAIGIYDSALVRYPNSQNLMLNKAVVLMRMQNLDGAEKILKDVLLRNPFYSSAHFRLAQVELQKGQVIPSMMGLYTYLINNPSGPYKSSVIKLLDNLSKVTDNITEVIGKRTSEPEGNIAMVEQIVLSKIALSSEYKVLTDLDDPIIRQLQVMMEKLSYDAGNDDFFMQFYVPYLKEIYNRKVFEPAVFYAFSDVDVEKIQRYLKKNEKEITAAKKVIGSNLEQIRLTRELNYSKRQQLSTLYHFDNGVLFGKGSLEKEKPVGKWEFYYENGNIKSTGQFNMNGGKEGKWTYYYENGSVSSYDNWKNGLQEGEDLVYNRKGVLTSRANYSMGKLNGEKTEFFALGHVFSITTYKEGKESGKYSQYYSSGRKKIEAMEAEDELSGPYKSYHENGKAEIIATYANGKVDGMYKSYYDNGQLEYEAIYKNGNIEGPVKIYHRNGKVKRTSNYIKGLLEGESVEYNTEGGVIEKDIYKKGKSEGNSEYFDDDGKIFSSLLFENDKLKSAKYFDKTGKIISSSERRNKQIELTTFNAEGFKNSIVIYNDDGKKLQTEKYFYPSGQLKETDNYADGMLDGTTISYFPGGKVEAEINYSKDKKNGIFRNYYVNGQVKSEGWYDNDELNGDIIEYDEKGNIKTVTTYLNDIIYGIRENYFPNGKKDNEDITTSGWIIGLHQFDTAGKKIYTVKMVKGSGDYKSIFPNGKIRFEGKYVNGQVNGVFTNYYYDGTPLSIKNYDHGLLDGDYTEYYYGGKLANKGSYTLDKKTGTWKTFYPDGGIWREEHYVDGNQEGKTLYYFPNGKIDREIMYKDDERNGEYIRYSMDGELSGILIYKNDVAVSYTYKDKNGKLLPIIPIRGGNGNVTTYYSNGNKSAELKFVDGKLDGKYVLYHSDGKVYYQEEDMEYGLTKGEVKEYYQNGNVKTDFQDYYDNQDGLYKEYYENGKLKEEGNYYNGLLHGTYKYYDQNGKVAESRNYYYGMLLNVTK
jgi:antitoxin component YwqK of YwqJK toxin-antitoxin module